MEALTSTVVVLLAVAAVRQKDLLAAAAALGAYSLMTAVLWSQMNALDVAFTEVAVGAGISTVLVLAAIGRIGRAERLEPGTAPEAVPPEEAAAPTVHVVRRAREHGHRTATAAVLLCALVAAALVYATRDMPTVGDPRSPAALHPEVARRFQHLSEEAPEGPHSEVGMPNIVTSVLGDYRGYDTLGETTVIHTAALAVLLLLRPPEGPSGGSA
jgi:multicomponent Na+:H+ antiporter subunit B